MNYSTILCASTVIMFTLFIGIVAWAWSSERQSAFDAAAQLPFREDTEVRQ